MFFIPFLLFPCYLLAQMDGTDVPDATSMDGLSSTLVAECVNVISGEYVECVEDVVAEGPERLVWNRYYGHLHNPYFSFSQQDIAKVSPKEKGVSIEIKKGTGGEEHFRMSKNAHYNKNQTISLSLEIPKGFAIEPSLYSGRISPKHHRVFWNEKERSLCCDYPGGEHSVFSYKKRKEGWWLRQKELFKPSGHYYRYYQYKENGTDFFEILTRNSATKNTYAYLNYHETKEDNHRRMHVSVNGTPRVTYKRCKIDSNEEKEEERFYLTKVENTTAPPTFYSYNFITAAGHRAITRKERPNHRFLSILYGKKEKKASFNRVVCLEAPAGTTTESMPIYFFNYSFSDDLEKGGSSSVEDMYGYKRDYIYNKHLQPTLICHSFNRITISREKFVWKGRYFPHLKCKALENGCEQVHHAHRYVYDEKGNMRISRLYGQLTGYPTGKVVLDKKGVVVDNCCEYEEKTYLYSDDHLKVCTEQTDSNGTQTSYVYAPGTDRLEAKFVIVDQRIQLREFYTYDANFVIIEKTIDDGCTKDRLDLSGVTERHITTTDIIQRAPYSLPEKITESYLDMTTGEVRQLKSSYYTYSPEGKLLSQSFYDANNDYQYTISWEYDAYGNVISETTPLGETITKKYDQNNNLIYQEVSGTGYYTKNTYDYCNRLIKQQEVHPDVILTTTHTYNLLGRRTSTTDPYGHTTSFLFDPFGRLIRTYYPLTKDEKGQKKIPKTSTSYNIANYPEQTRDAEGNVTKTQFNIKGKPLKIFYPDDSVEYFYYRLDGELVKKIDKSRLKTVWEKDYQGRITKESLIDFEGNLLQETHHVYNAFHLLKTIDPEGITTEYTYDGAGRAVSVIRGNKRTEQTYDASGRIAEIKEWYGSGPEDYRSTKKTYDLLHRIIGETIEAGGVIHHSSKIVYDRGGNIIFQQDGEQITKTAYDTQRRAIAITNPAGETTHISYNIRYVNSLNQRVLQTVTTDPLGNQLIDTYNASQKLVKTVRKDALGHLLSKQEIRYSLNGNKCCVVDYKIKETGQEKITTIFEYTPDRQLCLQIEAAGTPEQKITRYEYNTKRQKIALHKPDGVIVYYTYDTLGRLIHLYSSDETVDDIYVYNHHHQVVLSTDRESRSTFREYDREGNLVREELGNGLIFQYTYDYLQRVCEVKLPDQSTIQYIYNPIDVEKIVRHHPEKTYTHSNERYNSNGQVLSSRLFNGETLEKTYDTAGRPQSIHSAGYHVENITYDAMGNLVHYCAQGIDFDFCYNNRQQLTEETGPLSHTYAFDSLSNRILKDDELHHYNRLNQLLFKGEEKFTYDPNGNLTSRDNKNLQFTYDALDRLVQVKNGNQTFDYTYDSFHRRLTRSVEGKVENFLYMGQEDIGRMVDGKIDQLKILGNTKTVEVIGIEIEGKIYVPLKDHANSIAVLRNLEGISVEEYRYTAFGEKEKIKEGGLLVPWGFRSHRYDDESKSMLIGRRYYAPDLARWMTTDPLGFADGSNLYAYLHNNPWKYEDSTGEFGVLFQTFYAIFGAILSYAIDFFSSLSTPTVHYEPTEERIASAYSSLGSRHPAAHVIDERSGIYNLNDCLLVNPETQEPLNLETSPNSGIGYCSGIMNRKKDHLESLAYLGTMSDYNIIGIHSASFGILQDAICYFKALIGYSQYETVKLIHQEWDKFFKEANPEARFLQIAHSRGCVYVRNALMSYPEELRKRIEVLAIAPGAFIPDDLCYSATHYVSKADIVPWLDKAGRERCKGSIIELDPHVNANKCFDHGFNSPTYQKAIAEHFKEYKKDLEIWDKKKY